jgi:S1-C subfamily serine protease
VEGSTSIRVTLAGGSRSYAATVVGVAPAADVAVLRLEGASGLTSATLADSSRLSVGQPVVAIGNAFGQGGAPSVTQGTITALNQTITVNTGGGRTQDMSGLIQSDAQISPGDSGGPLINSSGQVIGMITAGETQGRRQTTSSIGYSIPSNTALRFVNQIRSGQASPDVIIGQRGYLGVAVRNLDAATAGRFGLSITSGALVTGVASDSPAAQAGIAQTAVITAIDGAAIASADALGPAIRAHKPGERMQVSWLDQAGSHSATVILIAGPAA